MNFHNYMIYLLKLILQKKDFKYFTKQELFIYLSKYKKKLFIFFGFQ